VGRELVENVIWGEGFKIAKNRHMIFEVPLIEALSGELNSGVLFLIQDRTNKKSRNKKE